jgi:hypothetical protein
MVYSSGLNFITKYNTSTWYINILWRALNVTSGRHDIGQCVKGDEYCPDGLYASSTGARQCQGEWLCRVVDRGW